MRLQKTRGTTPEVALRSALHRLGKRFRIQHPVPNRRRRTIDIAFPRSRLAVFVDGCFWHGCPVHRGIPNANHRWWAEKLAENRLRDEETTAVLVDAGWSVLRIWEHEDTATAARRVVEALGHCSAGWGTRQVIDG